ncbi:MAG: nickel pincer cofactor biosynthesis protein LarB [Gemmatimonadetes bacterium]|nr:nickel pincer cofactor biosynthesis protein LarB [Gemmatimonadota bacterium]
MNPDQLERLLREVAGGRLDVGQALDRLRHFPTEAMEFAQLDHHRPLRQGQPEVIFAAGKTVEQVLAIAARLAAVGGGVLATRVTPEQGAALAAAFPALEWNAQARTAWLRGPDTPPAGGGRVLVVSAGTSDLPVAEEAAVTATAMGHPVDRLADVGVAGIHRLLSAADRLHEAAVLIVCAGMEGALPSVVGGLVARPVIAVPTSVGYGASFGGVAALLAMLNSCAAGITVVNIDNGFGAAMAAHRILGRAARAGEGT